MALWTVQVQDLEHQLFEAKLNQYNHDGSGSDSDSEGEAAESEVRSSSELKEVTEEERARCEDLQSANVKIDELEAEVSCIGIILYVTKYCSNTLYICLCCYYCIEYREIVSHFCTGGAAGELYEGLL